MEKLYFKGLAIINSCVTPRQLTTARNWVKRLRVAGFEELADNLVHQIYEKDTTLNLS
jgi:hypothetical protein